MLSGEEGSGPTGIGSSSGLKRANVEESTTDVTHAGGAPNASGGLGARGTGATVEGVKG